MSKSFMAGMMIALMLTAQGLLQAQTTAPSTHPTREKFVYHPLLVDPKWFSTLLDVMLSGKGGGSLAYREEQALIAAAATNPSKQPPIIIPREATDPMLPVRDRFAVAYDPKDQAMIISTTVADWPAVKRAIDSLQQTVAVISITATIVELPPDNAAAYGIAIHALETQQTPAGVRIVRESNGIDMVIADGNATSILKNIDATDRLKSVGTCNATTQINILSMLALTGNGVEIFSSDETAKARRRPDVELLVQFKPTATVDGAAVMDLATVVRQRGDQKPATAAADVADHSTLTRLAMELNQSIVLFGRALRRTDQQHTPVMIILNVALTKDRPE